MKKFIILFITLFLIFSVSCDSQPKKENEPDDSGIKNEEHGNEESNETLKNGDTEKFIPNNPNFYEELENDPLFAEFMNLYWEYPYARFYDINDFILPDTNLEEIYGGSSVRKGTVTVDNPLAPTLVNTMFEENGEPSIYTFMVYFFIMYENEEEIKELYYDYLNKLKSEEYGFVITLDDGEYFEFRDNFYKYHIELSKSIWQGEETGYCIWVLRTLVNQEYLKNTNILNALGIMSFVP